MTEISEALADIDNEREMLLARINHLDTLALAARAIVVPVTIAAAIACIGRGIKPIQPLPLNIQFVLPLIVIAVFYIVERRFRLQYEPCKLRWQKLVRSSHEPSDAFDWIKSKTSGSTFSEFGMFYTLLTVAVLIVWLAATFNFCIKLAHVERLAAILSSNGSQLLL